MRFLPWSQSADHSEFLFCLPLAIPVPSDYVPTSSQVKHPNVLTLLEVLRWDSLPTFSDPMEILSP